MKPITKEPSQEFRPSMLVDVGLKKVTAPLTLMALALHGKAANIGEGVKKAENDRGADASGPACEAVAFAAAIEEGLRTIAAHVAKALAVMEAARMSPGGSPEVGA